MSSIIIRDLSIFLRSDSVKAGEKHGAYVNVIQVYESPARQKGEYYSVDRTIIWARPCERDVLKQEDPYQWR